MLRLAKVPSPRIELTLNGKTVAMAIGPSRADILRQSSDEEIARFIYDLLSPFVPMADGSYEIILCMLRKRGVYNRCSE